MKLRLPAEWWWTDTSYRYWTVEPMVYFTTRPLSAAEKRRFKLKAGGFAGEVTEVDPLSESLKLHTLKKGDLVYAVDGVEASKLTNRVELYIKLTMRAGESAKLKLLRDNQPSEMTLKTHRQYFRKQRTE